MRLLVLLLTASAMLGFPSQGVTQTVRLGVMGGLSQTGFEEGEEDVWDSRTGYAFRAVADIGRWGPMSILTEGSWSVKGAERAARTLTASDPGSSFKLSYLSFGILANYSPETIRWDVIEGSVFAGPTVGFLLDCQTRGPHAERWGSAETPQQEIDCDKIDSGILDVGVPGEEMNQSESGFAVGVQVRWNLDARTGVFEIRYDHGFGEVDPILDRANRALTLSAGMLLKR